MKNRKILFGIAALVCAAMVVLAGLAACNNGTTSVSGDASPSTAGEAAAVSYISRDSSGNTYVLRIIPGSGAASSIVSGSGALFSVRQSDATASGPYTPKQGDKYELTIIDSSGNSKTSTGTVASSAGGSLSLQPQTASASYTPFTVTVDSAKGEMSAITGAITITVGTVTTVPAPSGTLTDLVPEVDQDLWNRAYTDKITGSGEVFILYADGEKVSVGTFTDGKLTVALPEKLDANQLKTFAEVFNAPGIDVRITQNFYFRKDGEGNQYTVSFGKQETPTLHKGIVYLYFANAVTIDTVVTPPKSDSKVQLKGNFTAGWNKLYYEDGEDCLLSTDLSKVPTEGMKWRWDKKD